jgi:RNA polymerase sigma factor (sigma-70 family)
MPDHPRSPHDLEALDDASLVRLARDSRAGDDAERETTSRAIGVLHLRRTELVRAVVAAKVPREAVDDLACEVWARFSRTVYLGTTEIASPAGVLVRIAQRVVADHFDGRRSETSTLGEWDAGAEDADLDDVGAAECIDRLLAPLSDRQREVVWRRIIEEQPSAEVAAELGTTAGNIDVIVHRSLRRLREEAR